MNEEGYLQGITPSQFREAMESRDKPRNDYIVDSLYLTIEEAWEFIADRFREVIEQLNNE